MPWKQTIEKVHVHCNLTFAISLTKNDEVISNIFNGSEQRRKLLIISSVNEPVLTKFCIFPSSRLRVMNLFLNIPYLRVCDKTFPL